jgi:hypothetical protein
MTREEAHSAASAKAAELVRGLDSDQDEIDYCRFNGARVRAVILEQRRQLGRDLTNLIEMLKP